MNTHFTPVCVELSGVVGLPIVIMMLLACSVGTDILICIVLRKSHNSFTRVSSHFYLIFIGMRSTLA